MMRSNSSSIASPSANISCVLSKPAAEASRAAADASGEFAAPIVTEITAASRFWVAEDYHQDYYRANRSAGYCRAVIAPKLGKLGLEK